jgi:hypothetical protein
MSAVGNRLFVGQDRLLRSTLLSASVSQWPRVLAVVPPEDVKEGILKADGLQRALAPVTAAAGANTAAVTASSAPWTPATRRDLRLAGRDVWWSRS